MIFSISTRFRFFEFLLALGKEQLVDVLKREDFELANLPRLESLTIGVFDKESWNFSCSSFILRDLPMLKSVILGDKTFGYSTHTVFESIAELLCFIIDLERLETIKVGDNSLNGVPKDDCSLIMKGIFNH